MRVILQVLLRHKLLLCSLVLLCLVAIDSPPVSLHVLILPHHDLIRDRFPMFYERIPSSVREKVKTIYLFSPNHFFPDDVRISRSDSPVSQAKIDLDHGIQIHLPLISQYFPHAKVIPYLFTRHVTREELDHLLQELRRYQNNDSVFFIASVDFSHGLSFSQAMTQDDLTMEVIRQSNLDSVLRLQDESLDCPSCLYLAMQLSPLTTVTKEPIFHGNSAQFLSLSPNDPTTSYFVFAW